MPKVNKSDMVGTMESTKQYHRSCQGVVPAHLAFVIRKTITVQTYGNYPTYAILDDGMIARMLNLSPEKNKLLHETSTKTV